MILIHENGDDMNINPCRIYIEQTLPDEIQKKIIGIRCRLQLMKESKIQDEINKCLANNMIINYGGKLYVDGVCYTEYKDIEVARKELNEIKRLARGNAIEYKLQGDKYND